MQNRIFTLFVILCFLSAAPGIGAPHQVTATGKFVMGDLDSKKDARSMALMNAKQMALEQAGTYLSSLTRVINFTLSSDEITSLAAGIISVSILDEQWRMEGESPVVEIKIRAEIDTGDLDAKINALKTSSSQDLVAETREIHIELARLKEELAWLKAELDRQKQEKNLPPVAMRSNDVMIDKSFGTLDLTPEPPDTTHALIDKKKETIRKLSAYDHLQNAQTAFQNNDAKKAVAELDAALEIDPDNFMALISRTRALEMTGNPAKALLDADAALKLNPESVKALLAKGKALQGLNNPAQAIAAFSQAIKIDADCGACYFERGKSEMVLKHARKAAGDFKAACKAGDHRGCEAIKKMGSARRPAMR